jgi:hypothetical protein
LLSNGELAISIVGDLSWPLAWQVRAARVHASRLSVDSVRRMLSRWPDSAALLCARAAPAPLLDALGNAINELDIQLAGRVRVAARNHVPPQVDRTWWLSIYQRLGPLDRLAMLAGSERDGGHGTASLAAPDCARAIEWCANQGLELPRPADLYRILSLRDPSVASDSMRDACYAIDQVNVYRSRMPGSQRAIDAIREVPDDMLRWATTELLIWRFLEAPHEQDFVSAIMQVRESLEPAAATGPRLWRGARVVARRNGASVAHLIRWNVWILDGDPPGTSSPPDPLLVRNLFAEVGLSVEGVVEPLLSGARSKDARRWLGALVPARKRGFSRPR